MLTSPQKVKFYHPAEFFTVTLNLLIYFLGFYDERSWFAKKSLFASFVQMMMTSVSFPPENHNGVLPHYPPLTVVFHCTTTGQCTTEVRISML